MQNSHFKPLANACHQVQFKKNLINIFREKFINNVVRSEMIHFLCFEFSLKIENSHLYPIFNACLRYDFRKIKWTDFEKNSKVLILSTKNSLFPHFWQNNNFSQKKSYVTWWCLLIPNLMQKNQKKVMSQFWEKGLIDIRADGWTDGQCWILRILW